MADIIKDAALDHINSSSYCSATLLEENKEMIDLEETQANESFLIKIALAFLEKLENGEMVKSLKGLGVGLLLTSVLVPFILAILFVKGVGLITMLIVVIGLSWSAGNGIVAELELAKMPRAKEAYYRHKIQKLRDSHLEDEANG